MGNKTRGNKAETNKIIQTKAKIYNVLFSFQYVVLMDGSKKNMGIKRYESKTKARITPISLPLADVSHGFFIFKSSLM